MINLATASTQDFKDATLIAAQALIMTGEAKAFTAYTAGDVTCDALLDAGYHADDQTLAEVNSAALALVGAGDDDKPYNVVNRNTGAVVATCKSKRSARRVMDRKDNQHGSYAHYVVAA